MLEISFSQIGVVSQKQSQWNLYFDNSCEITAICGSETINVRDHCQLIVTAPWQRALLLLRFRGSTYTVKNSNKGAAPLFFIVLFACAFKGCCASTGYCAFIFHSTRIVLLLLYFSLTSENFYHKFNK